jgi:trehalose 6-phosphate synthase/phosphatase
MADERIIIVSNRLPVNLDQNSDGSWSTSRSAGGLVTGLKDIHEQGKSIWIGYAGCSGESAGYAQAIEVLSKLNCVAVPLNTEEYDDYYNGLANSVIWPLFHYFPTYMKFDATQWLAYCAVNQKFSDAILAVAQPKDRIWIHDYHLMLLPAMLRKQSRDLKIAYFHHIPFPSSEVFRILPHRREILEGLLGADLVGFHTLDYVRHFLTSVTRLIGVDVDRDEIRSDGRMVKAGAFPLGIDVHSVSKDAEAVSASKLFPDLNATLANKIVFLGIDRLDYTKGIPERLKAFRCFLERYSEYVGKVVFLQVCVPSRQGVLDYIDLRTEVERIVGQINGEFGKPGYVPLQYLYQPFSPEQVKSFYQFGDVMLVTPLRDGLNLVAKEYIASRRDCRGILLLSEFAGASAEMGEALIVNPFDISMLADSMHRAVTMDDQEIQRRMQQLRARITSYNNIEWRTDFLKAWQDASDSNQSKGRVLNERELLAVIQPLLAAERGFLFFDYDGTLVDIQKHPSLATPSQDVLHTLERLSRFPNFEIVIMTGRRTEFCDQHLHSLNVHLIAEDCAFIRYKESDHWSPLVTQDGDAERIKNAVRPILESFVRRIPGSFIEEKATGVVLHYREANMPFAHFQALDLKDSLCQLLTQTTFSAFKTRRAIEIRPTTANKANVVERLLKEWEASDAIFITAGDDQADEDMFKVHPEANLSFHVGPAPSCAKYHFDRPSNFLAFLHLIARELPTTKARKPRPIVPENPTLRIPPPPANDPTGLHTSIL